MTHTAIKLFLVISSLKIEMLASSYLLYYSNYSTLFFSSIWRSWFYLKRIRQYSTLTSTSYTLLNEPMVVRHFLSSEKFYLSNR